MKLSIVLIGRNDNYNGKSYLQRIKTCINSLYASLDGIDFEIVLADYNQVKDKPPLGSYFSNYERVKHVVITNKEHLAHIKKNTSYGGKLLYKGRNVDLKKAHKDSFFTLCAWNAAFNETKGEYVLHTSSDNIFPIGLKDIIEQAQPNLMYRAERRICGVRGSLDQYEKIVNNEKFEFDTEHAMRKKNRQSRTLWRAAGEFILMDRRSWLGIGGYFPVLHPHPWRVDADILFRGLAIGKKIAVVDYTFINMFKPFSQKRRNNINNLNYLINFKGVNYNLKAEFEERDEWKRFQKWAYHTKLREGIYSLDIKYAKRLASLRKLFKETSLQRFTI